MEEKLIFAVFAVESIYLGFVGGKKKQKERNPEQNMQKENITKASYIVSGLRHCKLTLLELFLDSTLGIQTMTNEALEFGIPIYLCCTETPLWGRRTEDLRTRQKAYCRINKNIYIF